MCRVKAWQRSDCLQTRIIKFGCHIKKLLSEAAAGLFITQCLQQLMQNIGPKL